ncbi:MAG TPA: DUF2550 domain-containing protein [Jiangellaceae bacterium]|nr:DUF2550 domain-containing protein [Jiangellaceae bacterium]
MDVLQWIALVLVAALLLLAAVALALLGRRRRLQHAGGFELCLRLVDSTGWSGGWVFGVGRFRGDRLDWYRTFSLALSPKRSLHRDQIGVRGRRELTEREHNELPSDHLVLEWSVDAGVLEASMTRGSATAFLSWVESAPPETYF